MATVLYSNIPVNEAVCARDRKDREGREYETSAEEALVHGMKAIPSRHRCLDFKFRVSQSLIVIRSIDGQKCDWEEAERCCQVVVRG